jgi:hypothetical protein
MEKNEKRKKRQQVARFEPWPPWREHEHLPLSYQSICDFYVCVAYLFNEFIGFNNLIPPKKGPDETRTQHLQVRICMFYHWATHYFVSFINILVYL